MVILVKNSHGSKLRKVASVSIVREIVGCNIPMYTLTIDISFATLMLAEVIKKDIETHGFTVPKNRKEN